MRETLDYEDKNGKKWFILAIGEDAEGKGKFQIRRDGFLWKDKWIESKDLAGSMSDLGADIHPENRTEKDWNYFNQCLQSLGIEYDEPKKD